MDDLLQLVWLAVKTLYPIALLILSVRGFALWITERLRVTDWLGYIVFSLFLAAGLIQLWDSLGAWGSVPAIIGILSGLVWAHRDKRLLRKQEQNLGQEVLGFFLVSRHQVPVGVRNWFS